MDTPRYTIFIPTYNRERTIGNALESAENQTYRDFEILVIDDGSTDRTQSVIESARSSLSVPLRYIYQPNQGKHVAYNLAARVARGTFIVLLDSDDWLVPNALEIFEETWHTIPEDSRDAFAGVEGLCRTSAGELHGIPFPEDVFDADYITCRYQYGITGEKRHSLRSRVLAEYPYPVIAGERHVRPSLVWKRMAHRYRFRHINRIVQVVDFSEDGLTRNSRVRRLRTSGGLYLYYRDDLTVHRRRLSARQKWHSATQYIRYALRYGVSVSAQWREVPSRILWILALPRGLQDWLLDGLKAFRHRRELR